MYKLLWFILFAPLFILMQALQTDQELAVHTLFRSKYALNYAVHAAAQQVDLIKLSQGIHAIDEMKALETAKLYLQKNLQLDAAGKPLPGTFLQSEVKILLFEVINDDEHFPFNYENPEYNYEVTLHRPGVVMMIQVEYPNIYSVLDSVAWDIKASAEIVI